LVPAARVPCDFSRRTAGTRNPAADTSFGALQLLVDGGVDLPRLQEGIDMVRA
jgi:hypothetical protein